MNTKITPFSLRLFIDLAKDAPNWDGAPLFGGNVGGSAADRGNLTQLKRAGLLYTDVDDDDNCIWVYFTDAGKEFAKQHGINL